MARIRCQEAVQSPAVAWALGHSYTPLLTVDLGAALLIGTAQVSHRRAFVTIIYKSLSMHGTLRILDTAIAHLNKLDIISNTCLTHISPPLFKHIHAIFVTSCMPIVSSEELCPYGEEVAEQATPSINARKCTNHPKMINRSTLFTGQPVLFAVSQPRM